MIRFFIIMLLLATLAQADSQKYFIKFGSFKNLKNLEYNIKKLPLALRSHVVIIRYNSWYIPFAYYTHNKRALQGKVAGYKHYFKQAHIAKSSNIFRYPIVKNYSQHITKVVKKAIKVPHSPKVIQHHVPILVAPKPKPQEVFLSPEDVLLEPILPKEITNRVSSKKKTTIIVPTVVKPDDFKVEERKLYTHFTKEMLGGQYYYLAYKANKHNPNLLIKVLFSSEEVTYQPIIGEMKMTKANYLVDHNRLYMFTDEFSEDGAYSKLESNRQNYFLVSSWAGGKKLNTLRYYYKMNDAKRYLGLATSNGLSEVLQDGEFEDLSWN